MVIIQKIRKIVMKVEEKTIFDKTLVLLQHVEYDLLSERKLNLKDRSLLETILFNLFFLFHKWFTLKIKLFFKGVGFLFHDFLLIIFFMMSIYGILFFLIKLNTTILSNLYPFILTLVVYFVLFKSPSSFCTYNVKNSDIKTVLKILKDHNVTKIEYKVIKNLFNEFKENIKKRMLAFKGIVIIAWSILFYIFDKFTLPEIKDIAITPLNVYDFSPIFIYSILFFFLYGIIESYNKGVWYIIKSFEFALVEYEIHFEDV